MTTRKREKIPSCVASDGKKNVQGKTKKLSTSVCTSCKLSILTYILAIISCVGEFTPCETKLFSCKKVNPVVLVLGHSVHEKKKKEKKSPIFLVIETVILPVDDDF